MSYQTLLLDLDGTLIDSRLDLVSAVNHTLVQLGYPKQEFNEIVPRIGNGLRRLLRESIGLNDDAVLLKAKGIFETYYGDHCMDETVLYDDVAEVLGHFSNKLKLAVVTNKPRAFAEKILDEFGLKSIFPVVLGGDSLPKAKPDPELLWLAIEKLGGDRVTALMVGDGPQDLQAGKAAGVKTCMVRYGFGFHESLMNLNPDHLIKKFIELKEIVK
jgi:phosphoglycolate phosphatase